MAKPPSLVAAALATWNGKALLKGKKDISVFDKSVKNLGRTFGTVFGTVAIVSFSKKAIKAFADDEKAAKSLAIQLENTGNAFRVNEVESYIAGLQSLYGVLDDQLRPAFQTLLNATGSVTLSQQALETALNVSAGTGEDLASVVAAIAKGASGTTTALARLKTGLDKAIIASGDMNKIMAALDKKFAGQAQARLTTYAGKMDLLKVAAADATEIIGKGLIDAISAIGKDNSIDQAADSMNNFAVAIANTAKGMGELIGQIKRMLDSDVGKFLLGLTALLTLGKKQLLVGAAGLIAYDIGKTQKPASNFQYGAGNPLFRAETKAIKDSVFYRKQENEQLKKKTAVDALRDKFDLERIGLNAALNAAVDEETKLRIRSQIAILDNNEALAKKYLAELNAAENAAKLAATYETALASIKSLISRINEFILKQGGTPPTPQVTYNYALSTAQATNEKIAAFENKVAIESTRELNSRINEFLSQNAQRTSSQNQMDIKVSVDAGGDRLSQAIAESIQVATRSGYSQVPNGFLV